MSQGEKNMAIEFEKKKDEVEELPKEDEKEVVSSIDEEKRRLEIENAELRGFKKATEEKKTERSSAQTAHEQTKARVGADMVNMDDDKFQEIYKMNKSEARSLMAQKDSDLSREENKRLMAEAEAKVEMATKYGASFYQYKNQVEEAVADLSEDVRSNPARLAKAMERLYLGFQKEGPIQKKESLDRKKIVSDFEKPTPSIPVEKKESEEIPEQYRPLSKVFGIRDEKERKDLMRTIANGEFVPMDMGGGYWYKDPAKGFEKVEQKA